MANAYSQLYYQIIFGIRGTGNSIPVKHKDKLHGFISEVVANRKSKLIIANSMPDHIHLLVSSKPSVLQSDLVRDVKALSTTMLKDAGLVLPSFKWQQGYAMFSYAQSQVDDVYHYIENQEEHHQVRTFEEEYLAFLNKFEIEYERQYVFDKDQVFLPLRGSGS
ncbi:MAG TPA: transposase [Candidatus Kapabacteria bacterium]|jgi:REP element-mobilizing transposase RayT|nr:transposase [Candidatus Kapabacteria bacterium]